MVRLAVSVAEGKTNEEIAGALFVIKKTVEKHVTRVLAKLGFENRAQVAAWAAAKGRAAAPEDLDTLARG